MVTNFVYIAKIANLPPVFGLYTSFIGVILYPLFGTSKDVSLGMLLYYINV